MRLTLVLALSVPLAACDGLTGGFYLVLAKLQHQQGRVDEAIESYRKGIELQPLSAFAYNNLGNVLREKGRFKEAIEAYCKSIELEPDFAEAYSNLGKARMDDGQLAAAIEAHRKVVELQPYFGEFHYNLALALRAAGREEEAQKELAEAERLGYEPEEPTGLSNEVSQGQ